MTVKAINGTALLVQIGNGASPTETFTHDCLINTSRGIQFASETNRQTIPDCNNLDATAWQSLSKDALTATINGAGMLHTTSVKTWFNWFNSNDSKNVRVLLSGVSLANGGGHWSGAFKVTAFEVTGERNAKAECTVTLESDGAITWVDAE
jgi:predicted secreted protein